MPFRYRLATTLPYSSIFCFAILLLFLPLEAVGQQGDLFVSSRNTNSVKRYSGETGEYINDAVSPGSGGLSSTQDVAIGADGTIYVSGRGNSAILMFTDRGRSLGAFTSGYDLDEPTKMTFGPDGYLYVSQWGQSQRKIARFDATTGEFVDEFTDRSLNLACGHVWDADGNLYVAVFGSGNVQKFDSDGNFQGVFTSGASLPGPVNLWFDETGDLLVLDWELGSVLRFDGTTGAYKSDFVTGMTRSEGFVVGADGLLYICDWQLNKVNKYHLQTGALIGTFASGGGLLQPNAVTFGPATATSTDDGVGIGAGFELMQNYPNPVTGSTIIRYHLPRPTVATLTVYNLLGRVVEVLSSGSFPPGDHEATFDTSGLPSGVYFYSLDTGSSTHTRQLLVL